MRLSAKTVLAGLALTLAASTEARAASAAEELLAASGAQSSGDWVPADAPAAPVSQDFCRVENFTMTLEGWTATRSSRCASSAVFSPSSLGAPALRDPA
ncbi:MAG: hypothetical protein HY077_12290 [Elusimicrobia bacterium]|nr:hypothetical protein [Elusimicrobiota bacterium]